MSYSFSVKAATRAAAIAEAVKQFESIEAAQPAHVADLAIAQEAVDQFTGLLMDDDKCDVVLQIHGSVYTTTEGLRQVAFNINAHFGPPREA